MVEAFINDIVGLDNNVARVELRVEAEVIYFRIDTATWDNLEHELAKEAEKFVNEFLLVNRRLPNEEELEDAMNVVFVNL